MTNCFILKLFALSRTLRHKYPNSCKWLPSLSLSQSLSLCERRNRSRRFMQKKRKCFPLSTGSEFSPSSSLLLLHHLRRSASSSSTSFCRLWIGNGWRRELSFFSSLLLPEERNQKVKEVEEGVGVQFSAWCKKLRGNSWGSSYKEKPMRCGCSMTGSNSYRSETQLNSLYNYINQPSLLTHIKETKIWKVYKRNQFGNPGKL